MQLPQDKDDELDSFDQMEIEKRFKLVVGHAFSKAYLEDDHFRNQLSGLCALLTKKQKKFAAFNIADAVGMFLGGAYRSAKVSALIHKHGQDYIENSRLYDYILLVHHDLVDGVVHPLFACLNYLKSKPVAALLQATPTELEAIFKDAFGEGFLEVRHAIAHEEDRLVPAKIIAEKNLIDQIRHIQHRGTTGTKLFGLHRRNSDGETLEFDFSEARFLRLVDLLQKYLN